LRRFSVKSARGGADDRLSGQLRLELLDGPNADAVKLRKLDHAHARPEIGDNGRCLVSWNGRAAEGAGCEVIRSEKMRHIDQRRVELRTILDFIRAGDTLTVTRVDRLARSMGTCRTSFRSFVKKARR
jgi:hypothetical protein